MAVFLLLKNGKNKQKVVNMKNEIKFSESYEKLPINWPETQAVLIGISIVDIPWLKATLPKLIDVDTKLRNSTEHYPLDFERAIVLTFFQVGSSRLFTTMREYSPLKFEMYKERLWKNFTLIDSRLFDEDTS